MKTKKILHIIFAILTIAIDVFLIVESAMSGGDSSSQSKGFTDFIVELIRHIDASSPILDDLDKLHGIIRKLFGHFLAFGGSGLMTTLSLIMLPDSLDKKKVKTMLISLSMGLSLALLTEGIQLLAPGRAGQFTDVFIDFSGFFLFAGLTYLLFYFIHIHGIKKSERNN